jgi:hypothetical protein
MSTDVHKCKHKNPILEISVGLSEINIGYAFKHPQTRSRRASHGYSGTLQDCTSITLTR